MRNPHHPDVPCDPCKKKGFDAKKCGVRTWGPKGEKETFNKPETVVKTPISVPNNLTQVTRRTMQTWGIVVTPVPGQNAQPQPGTQGGQTFYQAPYVSNLTFLGEATHCRMYSRGGCSARRPGHGLDQLSLSSNPEVLIHPSQAQSPTSLLTHLDPRLTIRKAIPGGVNPNRQGGLTATQRMLQAQDIETRLRELGEDPEVIREVVAPLIKRQSDDV